MKKNLYKVVFESYEEIKVSAFNAIEASILAQAKRIESNKPYTVRYVERMSDYGAFEAVSVARLEVI